MSRQFRALVSLSFALALICGAMESALGQGVDAKKAEDVTVEVVKHDKMLEAIKKQRGKIVVIDVWATWCLPCVKEFHHLVEIHKQYGKDGVVCMSVSIDPPEKREAVLKFLKAKGAAFPNFILDEGDGVWDKLDLKSISAVFVYDQAGKLAKKFTMDDPDNQFTYNQVRKLVDELRSNGAK